MIQLFEIVFLDGFRTQVAASTFSRAMVIAAAQRLSAGADSHRSLNADTTKCRFIAWEDGQESPLCLEEHAGA